MGRSRALSLALLGLPLLACAPAEPPAQAAAPVAAPLRDPELAEVRLALEAGHGDLALALLERVQGLEPECLRARAALLRGDAIEAFRALERARGLQREHPELCATEAELLAALGRIQAAAEVLTAGFQRHGPQPCLLRAQGVVELQNQGRARAALEALERARARDPELPFLTYPLAQAHLLVGRSLLERAPAEATAHGRAARRLVPSLDDALELVAEGLTGELRFEEAIEVYGQLEAAGRSYGETPAILQQRCATRCLLEHDRAGAVEHYLAARRLGMDDRGLGFGAEVLADELRAALARGVEAAENDDWAGAEAEFARALELDPRDLEAENHLAVARFRREDFRGAAEAWEQVLRRARASGTDLPDPVALNLAKAWRLAGEAGRARSVLAELLDREPDGRLAEPARELLLALEAEELAGRSRIAPRAPGE